MELIIGKKKKELQIMLIDLKGEKVDEIDWCDMWFSYRYDSPDSPPWGCPWCGNKTIYPIYTTKRLHSLWTCGKCKKQHSTVTGTRFERSHVDMEIWLKCIHLVETYNIIIEEITAIFEVSYKTAWKMKKVAKEAIKSSDLLGYESKEKKRDISLIRYDTRYCI